MFIETGYYLLERLRKVSNPSWSMPTLHKINTIQTFIFAALKARFPRFFVCDSYCLVTFKTSVTLSCNCVSVSVCLSVSVSHTHIPSPTPPPTPPTHNRHTSCGRALILMELWVSSSIKHVCLDWSQQQRSEQNPYLSFLRRLKPKSSVLSLSEKFADNSIAPSHPGATSGNWGLLGKNPHSLSLVDLQKC